MFETHHQNSQESSPEAKWKRAVDILTQDILLGYRGASILIIKKDQSLDAYLSDVEMAIKREVPEAVVEITHVQMQTEDSEEGIRAFKRTIEELATLPALEDGAYKIFVFDGSQETRPLQAANAACLDSTRDILLRIPGRVVMVWAEDSHTALPGETRPPVMRKNLANCSNTILLFSDSK
jgi:hypothetical protein